MGKEFQKIVDRTRKDVQKSSLMLQYGPRTLGTGVVRLAQITAERRGLIKKGWVLPVGDQAWWQIGGDAAPTQEQIEDAAFQLSEVLASAQSRGA